MIVETSKNTGKLPDFFIIGAAKSGTSSLFNYLSRHPEIYIPKIKEPEYFSNKSIFIRGNKWYKNIYLEAKKGQLCGDASTTYTRWPHTLDVANLISKSIPDAKFIYIMRHPVDRAYSHYAHHMRLGITMLFEEALEKNNIYIDCSLYMSQIERYLKYFERERFLFLFQSDLWKNPRKVLGDITEFLEIKTVDLVKEGYVNKNVSGPDNFIRSKTIGKIYKIPGFRLIAKSFPEKKKDSMYRFVRHSIIGKRLEAQYQLTPMRPETRKRLLELFEKPNRELERFLGVKLSEWRI